MKIAKFLLLVLAVAIVVPMHAQSSFMKVNVPFNFTVNDHQMPSGDYELRPVNEKVILIRAENGATALVSLTEVAGGGITYQSPKLQFEKVGDQYFLSAAYFGETTTGRQFTRSKQQTAPVSQVGLSQAASD
jgi:hypothetical protein